MGGWSGSHLHDRCGERSPGASPTSLSRLTGGLRVPASSSLRDGKAETPGSCRDPTCPCPGMGASSAHVGGVTASRPSLPNLPCLQDSGFGALLTSCGKAALNRHIQRCLGHLQTEKKSGLYEQNHHSLQPSPGRSEPGVRRSASGGRAAALRAAVPARVEQTRREPHALTWALP